MTKPAGERIAVVETKLDAVISRLDAHDAATDALSKKLDTIISGQQDGRKDRADIRDEIAAVGKKVEAMEPDVQTIADIKKMGRLGKWTIGVGVALLAAVAYAKTWLVFNWNFFLNR